MKSDSQNPHHTEWRVLYRAVILETNSFKKTKRISEAEEAIIERMRELFREAGTEVGAEREAMDDAAVVFPLPGISNDLEVVRFL
jgi:hypothetical protein